MTVCILTNGYGQTSRGGSEAVTHSAAAAFLARGDRVVVCAPREFGGLRSLLPSCSIEDGVTVYRWYPLNFYALRNASRHSTLVRTLWTIVDTFQVHSAVVTWWVLRRERPDFVISENVKGLGLLVARVAARWTPRYVHTLHDVQLVHPSGLVFPQTAQHQLQTLSVRLYRLATRWIFRTIPIVCAPSAFLLDFHRTKSFFSGAVARVLPNPCDATARVREPQLTFCVGYVGQIEAHKGIAVLLESWKRCRAQNRRLDIVGDGALLDTVIAASKNDATIVAHGRKEGTAFVRAWDRIDVLVVPSLCLENSPLVIAEARARGVWVVASRVGGIPEFAHGWDGLVLIAPGDVAGLATAIDECLARVAHGVFPRPLPGLSPAAYVDRLTALSVQDHT